jgi:hypothetical protein
MKATRSSLETCGSAFAAKVCDTLTRFSFTPKPQNPKSVMSKLIVSELIDKFKLSTHV